MDRVTVAVALGSNLGHRQGHLARAVEQLAPDLARLRVSTWHETDPVDVPEPQPPYLNGAVVGETTLSPEALLARLLDIERQHGRVRPHRHAPRPLDLDLILYGDRVVETSDLVVPHPRFRARWFVLAPLVEIAPDLVDPVTRLTVGELLKRIG